MRLPRLLTIVCLLMVWAGGTIAMAQPGRRPSAEDIQRMREQAMRNSSPNPSENGEQKDGEKKDDSDEKKEGDKKEGEDEKKEDDASSAVKRPDEPPKPPDPRELEAKPDENGRITFSFNGQPWADVLQWLANVSDLSLDWRELPSDYLNLTTQRSYTLPEAHDLINRHLQARGYTILLSGEVMSVFKLDAIDPSLVPKATEEDLYDRPPHDIVKLTLALPDGMDPKEAVEDLKQALSPTAKALPLAASKRVLLIDTVANLRMVSALLNAEQMEREGQAGPREFVLTYVQASEVIDIIYVVLGLDPNSRPSQMELQMQQQKMQLMNQLARSGKDVTKMMAKDGPPVYLAYNRQRNSVLANAPPEQMRIIEKTIDSLDVPAGGSMAGGTVDTDSPRTLQQYRLKTIEPDAVVSTLNEIGNISPRAELRADKESKTLFARANSQDHAKIDDLIKQLDGAETVVEVFWLRRLPAEAVAGSIQSLIINKPKDDDDDDDYGYFSWRRRGNDDKDEEPDTLLRVDADVENNRLIVRGTPQQMDEVRDLLVKLGEPLDDAPDNRQVRTLEALDPEQTKRLLKQLEEAWPSIGGETELVLPPEPTDTDSKEDDSEPSEPSNKTASQSNPSSPFRLLAAKEESPEESSEKEPEAPQTDSQTKKPSVAIRLDAAGRLVLSSDDTDALNRLEQLLTQLAPQPDRYRVFEVKERSPDAIVDSLETYFQEFLEEEERELSFFDRLRGASNEPEPVRLSQRKPLRFLADSWSSTILVANATASQLREVERLINAWDQKPTSDRVIERQTTTVKLQHAQASTVVSAIKEIYRDLLSRGDSEFDTEEEKAQSFSSRYVTSIRYQDANGDRQTTEPAGIAFDGLLSLGADDESNVIVVSAQKQIAESILSIIDEMDQQARSTATVQVRSLKVGATDEVRQALMSALAEASAGSGEAGGSNDDRRDRRGRGRGRRGRGR